MKKTTKILTLILVLLAPIMVFLFLKQFGANKFALPVYYEQGSPWPDCGTVKGEQHRITTFLPKGVEVSLPAIFVTYTTKANEYQYDLDNVLTKYSGVHVWTVTKGQENALDEASKQITLAADTYNDFINCGLVLGEDQWLSAGIAHKYVLVDHEARIRGYITVNTLKEIERLDTELDILLNH